MQQNYTIMATYRILIVDDEEDICMILSYSLQKAGYETLIAHSAEEALALLQSPIAHNPSSIDLILLDIMMDGMSGLEMAEQLRLSSTGIADLQHSDLPSATQRHCPPIIFLSALSEEQTILKGFTLGADDYISKPFRIAEVLARVAAVLRRTSKKETKSILRTHNNTNNIVFEGIVVNKTDMSLTVDGQVMKITRKEIDLLCYLLTHRGQILSREQLLDAVWDKNGYVLERTIDVHITHLRRKLGAYGKHIITKSGYGYLFEN